MASISAECPICYERYSGPIFLCERGHSICGSCTSQITQCETCRAPMTKCRNYTLEDILSESAHSSTSRTFECCSKECSKKFQSQDELKTHQINCEFRDVICDSCNASIPVKDLICNEISCKKIPEILQKFKDIQKLDFRHRCPWLDRSGKCSYFNSRGGDGCEDCIFKLPQMNTSENLKELYINNLEINTGDVNIGPENLPNLKILGIYRCFIFGNLVTIVTGLFALEKIKLCGNIPLLEKNEVEALLRSKSLKFIELNKYFGRQIISRSFTPIGPNGKPFDRITQNAQIVFKRDSGKSTLWKMTMTNQNKKY